MMPTESGKDCTDLPHKLNNTGYMERGFYCAHKEENECYLCLQIPC